MLAQQLRENRLLRNVLDEQAADCIEAWRTGATAAIREDAWHAMRAIDDLRERIGSAIDDGTMAKRQATGGRAAGGS